MIGHPAAAFAVVALFLAAVAVFGLWIWTQPLQRAAALSVSAAIVVLVVVSWRRGAFRPRTVVEYRTEPGPPARGLVTLVSDGRAISATIELSGTDGQRVLDAPEAVVAVPGHLRRVRVALPEHAARELVLWVHAVTPDGASRPTPVSVEVDGPDGTPSILSARGGVHRLVISGEEAPATLTISLRSGAAAT